MGGLFGLVVGGVADRLVPAIQTPVEDIIYEVLDQKGLPTRSEVRDLRNKLDRLEKTIGDLSAALEGLRGEVQQAATVAAPPAAPAARAAAPKKAAPKKATAKKAAPKKATAKKAAPKKAAAKKAAPKKAAAKKAAVGKVCQSAACDGTVRAKGFCGKHYMQFKRGTLAGYVGEDGSTTHENVHYKVGAKYIGQVVDTSYEGDEVIFFLPEAKKTIRAKVNKVRID